MKNAGPSFTTSMMFQSQKMMRNAYTHAFSFYVFSRKIQCKLLQVQHVSKTFNKRLSYNNRNPALGTGPQDAQRRVAIIVHVVAIKDYPADTRRNNNVIMT